MNESMAEADRILAEAGWTPVRMVVAQGGAPLPNNTGRFAFDNLVCGHPPPGASATYAGKELSKIPQAMAESLGLDPADYPDEHHEAAAWLVAHFPSAITVTPEATFYEPLPEEEAHVPESQAAIEAAEAEPDFVSGGNEALAEGDDGSVEDGPAVGGREILADDGSPWPGDRGLEPDEDYEAEFEEVAAAELSDEVESFPELEAPSLGEEILDEGQVEAELPPQDRFYGLDDLDRRKTVAIGLVMRHAKQLMPFWTTNHDAALAELRNFAMGVTEGRWPDDVGRRVELESYETTIRRISEIAKRRDEKVEFLEAIKTHEEIEAFDPEADWP